jgi:hypothetical protein
MNINKLLLICFALTMCADSAVTVTEAAQKTTKKKATANKKPVNKKPANNKNLKSQNKSANTKKNVANNVKKDVAEQQSLDNQASDGKTAGDKANANAGAAPGNASTVGTATAEQTATGAVTTGTVAKSPQKKLLNIQMAKGVKATAEKAKLDAVEKASKAEIKKTAEISTQTDAVVQAPAVSQQAAPVKEEKKVEVVPQPASSDVNPKTMAEQLAEQAGKLKPAVAVQGDKPKGLEIKAAETAKRGVETRIKKLEEENVQLEKRVLTNTPILEARKTELTDLESKVSSQSGDEKSASEKKIEDLKERMKNIQAKDIDGSKEKIEENKKTIEKENIELDLATKALAALTTAKA